MLISISEQLKELLHSQHLVATSFWDYLLVDHGYQHQIRDLVTERKHVALGVLLHLSLQCTSIHLNVQARTGQAASPTSHRSCARLQQLPVPCHKHLPLYRGPVTTAAVRTILISTCCMTALIRGSHTVHQVGQLVGLNRSYSHNHLPK